MCICRPASYAAANVLVRLQGEKGVILRIKPSSLLAFPLEVEHAEAWESECNRRSAQEHTYLAIAASQV
jgi:hypothetical protein